MSTVAKQKVKDIGKAMIPTKEGAINASRDLGMIALGIIASHATLKIANKQDSAIASGSVAVAGFYGAMVVKNPWLRALALGVGAYGVVKTIGHGVQAVASPTATNGLAGLIPESAKEALRKYIPTFSGIEEVSGNGTSKNSEVNLDDQGNYNGTDDEPNYSGTGRVNLAA